MKRLLIPLLFAGLAVGCEQAPTSTPLPSPNFNANGPPPASGPFVIRFEQTVVGLVFQNPDEPILSVHATDDAFLCAAPTEVLPLAVQLVDSPNGPLHFLRKGTHFARVYHPATLADFFGGPGGPCGFLLGGGDPLLFASGTSRTGADNDNDVFNEGPGANAFGITINGSVEDAIGNDYGLHVVRRFVIKPDGTFKDLSIKGPDLSPDPF
jgi:hypothetical protein